MFEYLKNKKFSRGHSKYFHFMEDGHTEWANVLYSFIKTKNVLDVK
jgi:hypothetical protein